MLKIDIITLILIDRRFHEHTLIEQSQDQETIRTLFSHFICKNNSQLYILVSGNKFKNNEKV